jgi:molybdate transport system regulatory protein
MEKSFTYSIHIRLCADDKFFGPGTVMLLQNVDKMHSLFAASKLMSLSYSKATAMIKNAENHLGFKLLVRHTGGESGGGSELTSNARAVLSLFSDFTSGIRSYADGLFKSLKEEIEKLPLDGTLL